MNVSKLTKGFLATVLAAGMVGCADQTAATTTSESTAEATTEAVETTEEKVVKIAVVKQLDHASLDEIANAITAQLDVLAAENGITVEYGEVYSGQNDQSVLGQIASQVIADDVDVIVPIATLAAQTMVAQAEDTETPVVFAAISDPDSAGLTDISYVTGTSDALNTTQIMDMIFAQNPDVETVGLLYSKSEANSAKPIEEAKAYLDEKGIKYVEATASNSSEVKQAASSLIGSNVDAIFTPTDNVIMDAELAIYEDLAEAGIPHYTGADSFVRNGAFTTCGVNYTELGKETANLAFQTAVEGIEATGYAGSYEVMPGGIITVNTETAEALNVDYSVFAQFGEVVEVATTAD